MHYPGNKGGSLMIKHDKNIQCYLELILSRQIINHISPPFKITMKKQIPFHLVSTGHIYIRHFCYFTLRNF